MFIDCNTNTPVIINCLLELPLISINFMNLASESQTANQPNHRIQEKKSLEKREKVHIVIYLIHALKTCEPDCGSLHVVNTRFISSSFTHILLLLPILPFLSPKKRTKRKKEDAKRVDQAVAFSTRTTLKPDKTFLSSVKKTLFLKPLCKTHLSKALFQETMRVCWIYSTPKYRQREYQRGLRQGT